MSGQDDLRLQLLTSSLLLLAQCLYTVYKRPAYILIDEYDVPLLRAAASSTEEHGYYERLRDLICSLLGKVVKTGDPAVRRCILTGCLHLTLSGRFSGLNNLLVLGMEDHSCAGLMGFTQAEVDHLLRDYGLSDRRQEIRGWYYGYVCGGTRLYNPWSVMHYCRTALSNPYAAPRNYWAETSSDDFRPFFLNELSAVSITRLQCLLDGGVIPLRLRRAIGYADLQNEVRDDQAFFSLLYYAGYLTRAGDEDEFGIPNCEVLDNLTLKIRDCFTAGAAANPRFRALAEALLTGNPATVQNSLNWLYSRCLDMQAAVGRLHRHRCGVADEEEYDNDLQWQEAERRRDERELGYQALTQGVLALFEGAAIAALTAEHTLGTGRAGISCAGSGASADTACLLEFRVARDSSQEALDEAARQGLQQTRDHGCAAALLDDNPALQVIYSYGIGCRAKACRVRVEAIRREPS